jgi:uncharacterized protein (TIGR02217 family)
LRSLDDIGELIAFFEARQGQMFGFRWKDWADYKSCRASQNVRFDDQVIARGDGATVTFQLIKRYWSGDVFYDRPVTKPVKGSVRAGVQGDELLDGVHYEVDETTGLITFAEPPLSQGEVTAGFEFDVPVRFDTDSIRTSVASFHAGEVPDVPVVEVRV